MLFRSSGLRPWTSSCLIQSDSTAATNCGSQASRKDPNEIGGQARLKTTKMKGIHGRKITIELLACRCCPTVEIASPNQLLALPAEDHPDLSHAQGSIHPFHGTRERSSPNRILRIHRCSPAGSPRLLPPMSAASLVDG